MASEGEQASTAAAAAAAATSGEELKESKVSVNKTEEKEKKRWADEEDDDLSSALNSVALSSSNETATSDAKPSVAVDIFANENFDSAASDDLVITAVSVDDTPYSSAKRFEDLNLSDELMRGIYSEMGFKKPSKIQAITLPMILTPPYQHLIAQAHNGSGKTTCFVLGMLSRVDPTKSVPQAICVCPTRELALQNQHVLQRIGRYTRITCACAVKTDSRTPSGTTRTVGRHDPVTDQVVIGTPGTLRRWIATKVLSTRFVNIVVFDEADHMLAQSGFQDDSLRILRDIQKTKSDVQILLFSATFEEDVKNFAKRVAPKANSVFVQKEELSLDVIKQYRVVCPDELAKIEVLKERIFPNAEKLGQTIIFVRTRESARKLHKGLEEDGFKCTSISGELSTEQRDLVIGEFKQGLTRILISTDVLARGFDQAQVSLVVNFDLPVQSEPPFDPNYEVYLHRIGRTGRFGRKGAAFNFVSTQRDQVIMDKIQNYFQREVPEVPWNDDDAFTAALRDAGLA